MDLLYSRIMASSKFTKAFQISIVIAVGLLIAAFFLLDNKSDPQSRARSLVPDELVTGEMISGYFGNEGGAALFKIEGPVPASMHSIEVSPRVEIGRVSRISTKTVHWKTTPPDRGYAHNSIHNCSCFACAKSAQICETASDWFNKEGSLFYLNSDPKGTSYILNRDNRTIIVVWNRAL